MNAKDDPLWTKHLLLTPAKRASEWYGFVTFIQTMENVKLTLYELLKSLCLGPQPQVSWTLTKHVKLSGIGTKKKGNSYYDLWTQKSAFN